MGKRAMSGTADDDNCRFFAIYCDPTAFPDTKTTLRETPKEVIGLLDAGFAPDKFNKLGLTNGDKLFAISKHGQSIKLLRAFVVRVILDSKPHQLLFDDTNRHSHVLDRLTTRMVEFVNPDGRIEFDTDDRVVRESISGIRELTPFSGDTFWLLMKQNRPFEELLRLDFEIDASDPFAPFQSKIAIALDRLFQDLDSSDDSTVQPTPAPRRVAPRHIQRDFRARKVDFEAVDRGYRDKGRSGEEFVADYEREWLIGIGRQDLAERVKIITDQEGDGAGYDVLSFFEDGREKFIEVKSTNGQASTPFFITPNELDFADAFASQFELIRVVDLSSAPRFFRIPGDLRRQLILEPVQFRAIVATTYPVRAIEREVDTGSTSLQPSNPTGSTSVPVSPVP